MVSAQSTKTFCVIPPFGAAALELEDERMHSIILGCWHTIITPPMVFARLVVEVLDEMRAKGIGKAGRGFACRRRRM